MSLVPLLLAVGVGATVAAAASYALRLLNL